jgi:hypothetical protein
VGVGEPAVVWHASGFIRSFGAALLAVDRRAEQLQKNVLPPAAPAIAEHREVAMIGS